MLQQINIEAADDIVDLREEENQIRAALLIAVGGSACAGNWLRTSTCGSGSA